MQKEKVTRYDLPCRAYLLVSEEQATPFGKKYPHLRTRKVTINLGPSIFELSKDVHVTLEDSLIHAGVQEVTLFVRRDAGEALRDIVNKLYPKRLPWYRRVWTELVEFLECSR